MVSEFYCFGALAVGAWAKQPRLCHVHWPGHPGGRLVLWCTGSDHSCCIASDGKPQMKCVEKAWPLFYCELSKTLKKQGIPQTDTIHDLNFCVEGPQLTGKAGVTGR